MDPREIARQARLEYEIIGHVRQPLRLSVEAELTSETAAVWLDRVRFMFQCMARHLGRLFKFEEAGGHLVEVEKRRPSLGPRLDKIRADHDRLLKMLAELEEDMGKACESDLQGLRALRGKLGSLLDTIRQHESDEIGVIQEAFWLDIGGES